LNGALVDDQGSLLSHTHVFVNGRDFTYLPLGLRTPLKQADSVDIFPPVAGG
jgi:molybdopterin converting factor small subunit